MSESKCIIGKESPVYSDGKCVLHTEDGKRRIEVRPHPTIINEKHLSISGEQVHEEMERFLDAFEKYILEQIQAPPEVLVFNNIIFPDFPESIWRYSLWNGEIYLKKEKQKLYLYYSPDKDENDSTEPKSPVQQITFNKCKFTGDVFFENFAPNKKVLFDKCQFAGEMDIRNCHFSELHLFNCHFAQQIRIFPHLKQKRIEFKDCVFQDISSARITRFDVEQLEEINLDDIQLDLSYHVCRFLGKHHVSQRIVSINLDYLNCVFYSDTNLSFLATQNISYLSIISSEIRNNFTISSYDISSIPAERLDNEAQAVSLKDIKFRDEGHVYIGGISCSNFSFQKSDFYYIRPRIDFGDVRWHFKNGTVEIYDERLFKDGGNTPGPWPRYSPHRLSPPSAKEVERIYRNIRLSYESKGNYQDAGDFFAGEMRMREARLKEERKNASWLQKPGKSFLQFLHYFYGKTANWGESPQRVIMCFMMTLIVLALLCYSTININNHFQRWNDIIDSFSATLQAMTFFKVTDVPASFNKGSHFILILAHILGAALIAIFGISLRRRFRRMSAE